MSRAQHTPGPWTSRGKYVFAGSDCIGIFDTDNASDGRMEANARMAAAAPDMLEAIKRQVANIERWLETGVPADPDESRSIYEQLRAALAKAEGRS